MRALRFSLLPLFALALAACSKNEPASTTQTTSGVVSTESNGDVPAPIESLYENAVALYDAADAQDWGRASSLTNAIQRAHDDAVGSLAGKEDAVQRVALANVIGPLAQSVAAHDQVKTESLANEVSFYAMNLADGFHPTVPITARRLEYYARAMHLATVRNDPDDEKQIAEAVSEGWASLRPDVLAHGGNDVAAKADALVARIASRPGEEPAAAADARATFRDVESLYRPGSAPAAR